MKMKFKARKHSLKAVALFTGTILWFYVLNASRIRLEKIVTIQYVLPDNVVFATKPPQEATVMLEGPRAFMRSMMEREEKVLIDLSRSSFRDNLRPKINVKDEDLNLPFGVLVEKLTPRILPLKLERKASKIVPVRYGLAGELPEDLQLQNPRLKPTEVEVVGPRSLIAGLKEVTTRPVDVESLYGQDAVTLEWNLSDDRLVISRPASAQLSYELKARKSNLVLERIPIRILGEGALVREQTVTLILWAPKDMARRVEKSDLNVQVWADIPDGARGKTEVELRAVLPPRLHLLDMRPKRILVEPSSSR